METRILEIECYDGSVVFVPQRTVKFLWIFKTWKAWYYTLIGGCDEIDMPERFSNKSDAQKFIDSKKLVCEK